MLKFILFPALLSSAGIAFSEPATGTVQTGPTLSVSGHGEVLVEPDQAVIQVGVRENASTAAAAQEGVNKAVRRVLDAFANLAVDPQQIRTSQLNLHAVYSDPRSRREEAELRIIGYDASYTLSVTIQKLDRVSAVIDTALDAGANQLQGVRFELRDDASARQEALRRAVADAVKKGEVVAEAAGTQVVRLLDIVEGGAVVRPALMRRTAPMAAEVSSMPTPVLPGQVTVSGQVSIRYLLKERD